MLAKISNLNKTDGRRGSGALVRNHAGWEDSGRGGWNAWRRGSQKRRNCTRVNPGARDRLPFTPRFVQKSNLFKKVKYLKKFVHKTDLVITKFNKNAIKFIKKKSSNFVYSITKDLIIKSIKRIVNL